MRGRFSYAFSSAEHFFFSWNTYFQMNYILLFDFICLKLIVRARNVQFGRMYAFIRHLNTFHLVAMNDQIRNTTAYKMYIFRIPSVIIISECKNCTDIIFAHLSGNKFSFRCQIYKTFCDFHKEVPAGCPLLIFEFVTHFD